MNKIMKRIASEYVVHDDHEEVKQNIDGTISDHNELLKKDQNAVESITEISGDPTQNAVPGSAEVCEECGEVVQNGECCKSELRNAPICDCGCNDDPAFEFDEEMIAANKIAARIHSGLKK